ncbi:MAG: sigma-70 family RNA polymerase sigma factor [Chitinophagia bacterium]|nr:sigma-70 family RNA polymerase sigma factor [Chitinophagia bacterium]NCA30801.1 sigma-70 family RNA polymerase sigma factor [Chitinophagia bacterium]
MLLQLNGIGNQKIQYRDHSEINFDSLDHYVTLAKKSIAKFSNQFYQGLSAKMLKDEDAISSVANAIMMADWRWDENYQNEKGTKKTRYSYRNQCALWAIQTYITKDHKKDKKFKKKFYSLDHVVESDDDSTAHNFTQDEKMMSPDDILIQKEDKEELTKLIESLLSLDCLTPRQKDYIRLYYFESYTFEKIGQKYGITREAVRQGLNKAINMIKETVNV